MPDETPRDATPHAHAEDNSASGEGRRAFLKRAAAGTLGVALGGAVAANASAAGSSRAPLRGAAGADFQSAWPSGVERTWIGPDYWANPLQDWRLAGGRAEMIGGGERDRTLQLLTRRLADGGFELRAHLGFHDAPGESHAGFVVGVQGEVDDYRSAAVYGEGLKAGLTSAGELFIGEAARAPLSGEMDPARSIRLVLTAASQAGDRRALTLRAEDPETGAALGEVQHAAGVPPEALTGGVALLAGYEAPGGGESAWNVPRVWFEGWRLSGAGVAAHPERAFGPILFAQYTLSRGTMKMTAQLPPVGAADDAAVRLQTRAGDGGAWQTVSEASIDEHARTATFRVEDWDDTRDVPYRLAYRHRTADGLQPHRYEGTVRRDPVEKDDLVVAGLSCHIRTGFPYPTVARGVEAHDPDLVAFTGDQYYESDGGYGVQRIEGEASPDQLERALLDMLNKWTLHGWAFGELSRSRPAFCMPDDHDVYHGNVWGEGGKTVDRYELHNRGGYLMPPAWVNAVQRTQTAHLPDPADPTPARNGIGVYYTDLVYGRVSFAILEDRKWKSGPDGLVPAHPGRPDHVTDLGYDPSELDVPSAELLGARQEQFLEDWAADWRGADMKAVVSQSAFAQVPTHHGGDYMYLAADLDSNGWPQTPRDAVVRTMRKGLAFHLGGDQHLPMILRYGLDAFDDAPYNFSVPAIAAGYPRAFWPQEVPPEARTRFQPEAGAAEGLPGRYTDGLANKVTVHAVANPKRAPREPVLEYLHDKASGYGLLRFRKPTREITMEAWPILSDPQGGDAEQFAGWPKTIRMEENDGRSAAAHLPTLDVEGAADPVVQVTDEADGAVLYTQRIQGRSFRPRVFRTGGTYTVKVSRDGDGWQETFGGVQPASDGEALRVRL